MAEQKVVEQRFKKLVYFVAALMVLTLVVPCINVGYLVYEQGKIEKLQVIEGNLALDIEAESFDDLVILNGEWHCYEGVYLENEMQIAEKITEQNPSLSTFPIASLSEATGQKTYKMNLELSGNTNTIETLDIAIKSTNESVKIYFNGKQLESVRPIKSWIGGEGAINIYSIEKAYDSENTVQEILISVNEHPENTDLYRREIQLGTNNKIMEQYQRANVLQIFLVGLMLLSITMGLVYLIIMPSYSVLTFMNLFDAALMLYLYYALSKVPMIISSYYGGEFQDGFLRGQALMMLFIAGALGNILGQVIYDPDKQCHPQFSAPLNGAWFAMAFYFCIHPEKYNTVMLNITLVLLGLNFVGLIEKMWKCYQSPRWNKYIMFHTIKTTFVGVIIMYDVLTLNTYPRNDTLILMCYVIFFEIHFFIRAYEYTIPFKQIEKHNEDLEKAVKVRTEQLTIANQELKDMNIKDSLTKAYNRLYFEELLLDTLAKYRSQEKEDGLYLCIFDMDNFKNINDSYGHSAGDDQLIELVAVVNELTPEPVRVSRIGGEEFTLLFDDYSEAKVLSIIEKIRLQLEELSEKEGRTTGSFGITKYKVGDTRKTFFIKADKCYVHRIARWFGSKWQ